MHTVSGARLVQATGRFPVFLALGTSVTLVTIPPCVLSLNAYNGCANSVGTRSPLRDKGLPGECTAANSTKLITERLSL